MLWLLQANTPLCGGNACTRLPVLVIHAAGVTSRFWLARHSPSMPPICLCKPCTWSHIFTIRLLYIDRLKSDKLFITELQYSTIDSRQYLACSRKLAVINLPCGTKRKRKYTPELKTARVAAAADRPARRSGAAHAKYYISHHMVIKLYSTS